MLVLAVDSALGAASVAILDASRDAILARRCESMDRGHAERLALLIVETLAEAGLAARDCGRMVATIGPGSFTGLRVAISAILGMAAVTGAATVGVSTLEALAAPHVRRGVTLAVIDARHDHVFAGLYGADGEALQPPGYHSAAAAALLAAEAGAAAVVGSGAALVATCWPASQPRPLVIDPVAYPDIDVVARLGAAADPAFHPAKPLYLKAVAATPSSRGVIERV